MQKTQSFILLTLMSIFLLSACGQSPEPVVEDAAAPDVSMKQQAVIPEEPKVEVCQLTMGWEPWEPYHYQVKDEPVKGLDIEMMEMISEETGCNIDFVKGEWRTLLLSLKKGEIDLLTGASITQKRKAYARFSDGYRTESFRLFVRRGEAKNYPGYSMQNFIESGFRLGVTRGYIYNDEVNTLQDDPVLSEQIIPVSTGLINFSKLLEGQIDGFLEDVIVGNSTIRRQSLESQIELHPYIINTGDVHVMFSKVSVDAATLKNFNNALSRIRADGRHQLLVEKYTGLSK